MPRGLRLRPRAPAGAPPRGVRTLSDDELVALASMRDADAFEVLYERYATAAYSLAYRMCGGPGMAEDVVQDAFLSMWRRLDRYDAQRGQVRSWLLGIVHNGAIDRLRANAARERRSASADGIEERLVAPERTEVVVAQRDEAERVRCALAQLPSDQRRVIELAYFDGLTHSQIAALLDLPVGTVKGRMRLGLSKLAALLDEAPARSSTAGGVAS